MGSANSTPCGIRCEGKSPYMKLRRTQMAGLLISGLFGLIDTGPV